MLKMMVPAVALGMLAVPALAAEPTARTASEVLVLSDTQMDQVDAGNRRGTRVRVTNTNTNTNTNNLTNTQTNGLTAEALLAILVGLGIGVGGA